MTVAEYIAEIDRIYQRGDATEHSYRPALQVLLHSHATSIQATNEPQQIAGNAPDYVVRRGPAILGHVEAKDIGEPLDKLLKTPQLKRYREALPNLVFTDYLEFLWIEFGEVKLRVRLGELSGRGIVATADAQAQWQRLSLAFFNSVTPTLRTPKQLANLLAAQTRLLRDSTLETLRAESDNGSLTAQHHAFRELLVPELTDEEFADMFAQTVAYGLFTARVFDRTPLDFSLQEAERLIPAANPFLRQFFRYVAFDLSPGVEWIVQGIVDVLRHADLDAVLHRQGRRRGFEDPVFHFYETFLAEYDPKLRESRGVYYTPEPVVDFIVRGVDHLLKTEFGKEAGLADPDTVILDPATGTATFLRAVIETIYAQQQDAGMGGMWPDYVRKHLLPRLLGFELMMAPYTVAHLKLALQLADRGFEFRDGDRLNVYLTNTLDRIQGKTGQMMAQWLTQESEGAEKIKRDTPVEVILGNPPYSGISINKSVWIGELIELYKREPDGSKLKERKHWLNDDYVKFVRFAHWRIAQTGHGIVAYITPHGWLDNPTFRGMRAALLRDFDKIYVIDLHGNANKGERTPLAHAAFGDDKNVFDIEQGVAILFFVRKHGTHVRLAKVYHAELWGGRESKYQRLENAAFDAIVWQDLDPPLPRLPFVPMSLEGNDAYQSGWSVTSIFPENVTGIATARDKLVLDFSAQELEGKIERFLDTRKQDDQVRREFFPNKSEKKYPAGDSRSWKLDKARKNLRSMPWKASIVPCLYRPFDKRALLYMREMVDWGRWETMRQLLDGNNIALITSRMTKGETFAHAQITDSIVEVICMSGKTSNNGFVFPLWLLPDDQSIDPAKRTRHPNLGPRFLKALADSLGLAVANPFGLPDTISAEDVFHYVYAVLHAPTYRARYAQYLRSDFPRIPLPTDLSLFRTLAALGAHLVVLHLLRGPALTQGGPAYPVSGDHVVEKIIYTPPKDATPGRIWINKTQYFEDITPELWTFQIGGYQVLEKWLKDRKGRSLAHDDITHYRKIALALAATQALMLQVDKAAAPLFPQPSTSVSADESQPHANP